MVSWIHRFGAVIALAAVACGGGEVRAASPAAKSVTAPGSTITPDEKRALAADYASVLEHRAEGPAAMRVALQAYLDAHPSSPNRADALVALGDIEVDSYRGDPAPLAEAKAYYREALRSPFRGPIVRVAAYKLGRVHVMCGEYDEAIVAFKSAIGGGSESELIRHQVLLELAGAFAFAGTPKDAYALFAQLTFDDESLHGMLVALAEAYDRLGKYPESRSVYDELRHRDPQHVCSWTAHYRHATPNADPTKLDADLALCARE